MKLLVDRLTATPTPHAFDVDGEWWAGRVGAGGELDHAVVEPFHFELKANLMGSDLFLEGRFRGLIELECGRCLARYRQPLQEEFQLVLEPAGGREPLDPEAEDHLARDGMCLGGDLDSGWYRGSEITLDELFGEVIALSMPIQPVCSEECAGLCPRCGADRNLSRCGCEAESKPASPFAALAALRESGKGGNA